MKPKILYIGDFNETYATENYITYGLEQLGYEVLRAQESQVRNSKVVLGAALQYKVEFVLFSKGHFPGSEEVIALLRANNVVSVGWIFDLFFSVPLFFGRRQLTNNAFRADICCMTDGGHLPEWRDHQVNHRLLRQGIHEPEAHEGKPLDGTRPEIAFFGTYSYHERIALVDMLRAHYGPNFRHYGRGGDVREIRGELLNSTLASTKVVVGDSMPSPNYWSNRIYEILGRGGFLLHPKVEGLDQEFIDGEHYVSYPFGDYKTLREKIDYYLAHDEERERIRLAGHHYVKTHFTYTERCKKLIEYVDAFKREKSAALLEQAR